MECILVATAGHIDHGKTSIIKALNGFEGDGSREEQRRSITIDLSFSHLYSAEHDKNIAFIDVPGHHKLTKTMIAGAFSSNYLLLVVNAKEGIMPQTKEHLHIAAMLGIDDVIVAITHKDIVNIQRCYDVQNELHDLLLSLSMTPIDYIFTALNDTKSIDKLRTCLLSLTPKPPSIPLFRFYIDRVFDVVGVGCIASGTVLGGCVHVKDNLMCCDTNTILQVRGIAMHKQSIECVNANTRAALNVNIKHHQLKAGYVLSKKGYLRGFNRIDVVICVFDDSPLVKHNTLMNMFIGTKKCNARVLLLNDFVQVKNQYMVFASLEVNEAIFSIFGEKFILRENDILAGGMVLNPIADPLNKTQKLALLKTLYIKDFKTAFSLLITAHKKGFGIISSVQRFGLEHEQALEILRSLESVFVDANALIAYPVIQIQYLKNLVMNIIQKNKNALLSAQTLCLRESWASEALCHHVLNTLVSDGVLKTTRGLFLSTKTDIDDVDTYIKTHILNALKEQGIKPLAPYNLYDSLDIDRKSGDKALKQLCATHNVVRLQANLFIDSISLSRVLSLLRTLIANHGFVDVALAKEHLGISRKYAIAYLEYLDNFSDIQNINQRRYIHKEQ